MALNELDYHDIGEVKSRLYRRCPHQKFVHNMSLRLKQHQILLETIFFYDYFFSMIFALQTNVMRLYFCIWEYNLIYPNANSIILSFLFLFYRILFSIKQISSISTFPYQQFYELQNKFEHTIDLSKSLVLSLGIRIVRCHLSHFNSLRLKNNLWARSFLAQYKISFKAICGRN
jgi:hypothetical protein